MDSKYSQALTTCAACMAIKVGVVHLLTVRERLFSGKMAQSQDTKHWFGFLLPIVLGVVDGTSMGGLPFVERAERTAKNCAENEPFFIAVATAVGMTHPMYAALGTTLIQTYTAARIGHTVSYLMGEKLNTAFRTVGFLTGLGATFAMAGVGLSS